MRTLSESSGKRADTQDNLVHCHCVREWITMSKKDTKKKKACSPLDHSVPCGQKNMNAVKWFDNRPGTFIFNCAGVDPILQL